MISRVMMALSKLKAIGKFFVHLLSAYWLILAKSKLPSIFSLFEFRNLNELFWFNPHFAFPLADSDTYRFAFIVGFYYLIVSKFWPFEENFHNRLTKTVALHDQW